MTFYPTNCLYREALFAPTILARVAAPSSPVRHGSDASARPQRRVAARQPPAPAPRLGTRTRSEYPPPFTLSLGVSCGVVD